jgi:hypothetical protein
MRDPGLIGRKIDCPRCKYRFVVTEPGEQSQKTPRHRRTWGDLPVAVRVLAILLAGGLLFCWCWYCHIRYRDEARRPKDGWMGLDRESGYLRFSSEPKSLAASRVPAFWISHWSDGAIAKLPTQTGPFGLEISWWSKMTDAGLKELAGLHNLVALDLSFTELTDAGLPELADLSNLSMLNLSGTKVTDNGLRELAGLKNLAWLALCCTEVKGPGLKHLTGMKDLTWLDLGYTRVKGGELKHLAALKKLVRLDLTLAEVTDADLKHLAGLKDLTHLSLFGCRKVTHQGLRHLAGLENITTLNLSLTNLKDAGLKELAKMKRLAWLDVRGTTVTNAGLQDQAMSLPPGERPCTADGIDGRITLAVTDRWVFVTDLSRDPPRDALGATVLDSITLSAEQRKGLAPADARSGSEWAVPEGTARRFFPLLSTGDTVFRDAKEVTSVRSQAGSRRSRAGSLT